MSHSDSEINDDFKGKIRHHLRVNLKAKKKLSPACLRTLRLSLEPLYHEMRLIRAVSTHNTPEVTRLLYQGISANSTDCEKRSALHIAVTKGYTDLVELLLRHGADPNKRDSLDNTPLHLASCVQNIPIISLLINGGAYTHYLDAQGRHPVDLAFSKISLLKDLVRDKNKDCLRLNDQVKNCVELLMAFIAPKERMSKINNTRTAITRQDIDELEFMKLSISTKPDHELDDDISRLLNGIEKFKIM